MRIALLAPFGLQPKGTVSARMVPLADALAQRGHMVRLVIPPWDDPSARDSLRTGSSVATVVSADDGRPKWAEDDRRTIQNPKSKIQTLARGYPKSERAGVAGVHTVALALPEQVPNSIALTYGLIRQALSPTTSAGAPFESEAQRDALHALTTFRAEVAHVFKPVGYSGLAGLVLSAMRFPWVLDVDDWEGAGGFSDRNRYSVPERASIFFMEALLPRLARAITAASRALQARAWAMGVPRRNVGFMPNGVWRDRYSSWSEYSRNTGPLAGERSSLRAAIRQQYGLAQGPVILLYTRFAEFPYRWALDIFRSVLSDHPGAHLLVVGNGFFNEEERLREDAERSGLGGRVAITGRVPEPLLPAYLSIGNVAIYPMSDTLLNRAKSPVKVIEPMLMGLPLVAHRVGQVADFVGDAGVLVEPGNLGEMASAVSALLRDRNRRNLLGAMAEQRVWSRFNWQGLSGVAERMYKIIPGM